MGTEPDDIRHLDPAADPAAAEEGSAEEREPFWKAKGFESAEAWLDDLAANTDPFLGPRKVPDVGAPLLAEVSRAALERELAERRRVPAGRNQAQAVDYSGLVEAAGAHGIAPSTLARILTARGARALVDQLRGRD